MSKNKGQQPLDLDIPKKIAKKNKGYYLPEEEIIDFVKDEAKRLKTSENEVLVAIVRFYQKAQKANTIDGDAGAAYDTTNKE
tara:strand:- start:2057 stop:2302 length:246 start_codon:yes stop_codon:yes gene_type:complete